MEKITNKEFPQRTDKQNRAGHKWFRDLAEALNDTDFQQKITFGTEDCEWTEWAVKAMYNKIAVAMYGKSSSQLNTQQFTRVSENLNRIVSEKGFSIPFPSMEELLIQQEQEEARKEEYRKFKNKMSPDDRKKYNKAFGEKD
jgi:hypothetical protein